MIGVMMKPDINKKAEKIRLIWSAFRFIICASSILARRTITNHLKFKAMLSIKVNYDGDSSKTFLCGLLYSEKHDRKMVFCDDDEETFRKYTNSHFYDSIEIIEHDLDNEFEFKMFSCLPYISIFDPIYTVYEHDRVYGGAEEGGWYYSTYEALSECSFEEYDNQTKDDYIYCGIFYGEREDLSTHHYC